MRRLHRLRFASRSFDLSIVTLLALSLVVACGGVSDAKVTLSDNGGSGGSGAESGGSAGSTMGGASTSGAAGTDGTTPACSEGQKRCSFSGSSSVERCTNEQWVFAEECGGTTPVCNAGTCGAFRLRGGISEFGVRNEAASYVLKEQSFSAARRVCGSTHCVTGSLN